MFPFFMSLGINDLWTHKMEYGNWSGPIAEQKIAPFELINKVGEIVDNESLKGKVVLLDFWFIGCGPCWVRFPEVQRIYEKYKDHNEFALFAVNRDDDPAKLFSRIEEKGYTFPVLRGTQKEMDALGVYKYPTVMITNKNGDLVFSGELEHAEKTLESMLE